MTVFVDTSIWVAAVDKGEGHHRRAAELLSNNSSLVTSDHVLVECWAILRNRLGRHVAETFWTNMRGGFASIENVTDADLEAAWHIGEAFPDQDFSIVDRTSFAVMLRLRLDQVASFDNHFAVFRHGPNRQRAFTVLR